MCVTGTFNSFSKVPILTSSAICREIVLSQGTIALFRQGIFHLSIVGLGTRQSPPRDEDLSCTWNVLTIFLSLHYKVMLPLLLPLDRQRGVPLSLLIWFSFVPCHMPCRGRSSDCWWQGCRLRNHWEAAGAGLHTSRKTGRLVARFLPNGSDCPSFWVRWWEVTAHSHRSVPNVPSMSPPVCTVPHRLAAVGTLVCISR